MNADDFNRLYPVGTPVFAYPGFRPEDASDARRLVTRTRTAAQVSASGDPVVWVEGEGSYICLTHVDPVTEEQFAEARAEETAAAVAALGALPVPVGDQPQPLTDERIAEIQEHLATTTNWSLGNLAARDLLAEVQRLKAERHSTNEALSDAVESLREMRHRLAEYEQSADPYPPVLPWAQLMDRQDLAEFLAELGQAAVGCDDVVQALDEVESTCGTWRLIAEAQHAHNTAPGPAAEEEPGMRHAIRIDPAEEANR